MLSVHLQSSLIDLKEHASSLASSGLKKDSKLKSLEIAIEQKKEECSKLETQLQKVGSHLTRTHVMKFEPPVVSRTNIRTNVRLLRLQSSFIYPCNSYSVTCNCIQWSIQSSTALRLLNNYYNSICCDMIKFIFTFCEHIFLFYFPVLVLLKGENKRNRIHE